MTPPTVSDEPESPESVPITRTNPRAHPISTNPRFAAKTFAAGVLLLFTSSVLVVVVTLLDLTRVEDRAQLSHVAFGLPLSWAIQDQSTLDPPIFPFSTRFLSPMEYETTVVWSRLGLSVGLVFLALGLLYLLVSRQKTS